MNKFEENAIIFLSYPLFIAAFIFFLPLMAFISLYIWCASGTPVVVRRSLGGAGRQKHYVFEFRIPTKDRGNTLLDAKRTRLGDFLYKSRLYMLPTVVNLAFGCSAATSIPVRKQSTEVDSRLVAD
jgi:lipopolysaccharide/colanic/teichoic acid biosynthesis glycosyltransferase